MSIQSKTYAETRQTISPVAAVKRKYKAQRTDWWEKGKMPIIIPLLMAGLDFIVFKLIIDQACFQSDWLSWVYSFGLAFAINFIPSQFVKALYDKKYNLSKGGKIGMVLSLTAFALLYFAMLYVRFCYFDMYLPDSGSGGIVDTIGAVASDTAAGTEGVRKAISMTLLTAISPLVTSIICGLIAYTADPLKAMLQEREIRKQELLAELHRTEVALVSFERDTDELIELDNARFKAAQLAIHDRCAALHAKAMFALEEYVGRADATSKISAEAIEAADAAIETLALPEPELPEPQDSLLNSPPVMELAEPKRSA